MKGVLFSTLLVGLLALSGCSTTGMDRYGRRTDDTYRRPSRGTYNYPASARVGGAGANAHYRVCHNSRNSLTLPGSAVRAHLNHGDSFGNCSRSSNRNDDNHRGRNGRDDRDDRHRGRNDDRHDDNHDRGRGRSRGRGRH